MAVNPARRWWRGDPLTRVDCAAPAGPTWAASRGPAASFRAAGEPVFTAPVATRDGSPGQPCTGPGGAVPPSADVIDSNGDVDANGAPR